MAESVKLENVTICYPHLFEKNAAPGTDLAKYSAEFILDPGRDAGKNFTVKVVRSGYTDATAIVPGTALTPGTKPVNRTVDLDKRDVVGEAITALWATINARLQALAEACSSLKTANETTVKHFQAGLILSGGLSRFHQMVTTASQECLQVPSLRAQIGSCAGTAGQKGSITAEQHVKQSGLRFV